MLGQTQDRIQNQEAPQGLGIAPVLEQGNELLQQQLHALNRLMNMKNMSIMTINMHFYYPFLYLLQNKQHGHFTLELAFFR